MTELKGQLQEDIAESGTHIEQPEAEPRQHSGKEIRDAIRLAIPEQDDEPKVLATAHITVEKNHGGIHIYQAGSEGPSINGPRKKSVEDMSGHELAIERARQDFKANMDSNRDILINKKIEQIGQEAYNNLPAAEKYKIQKAAETKAYSEYATATGNRERALLLAEVDDRMQAELDKKAQQKASRDQKKTAVPAAQFNAPIKEVPQVHSPISPTTEPDMSRGMNPDDTTTDDAERRESPDGATFSDDVVPDEETAIPAPIDTSIEPTTPGSAPVAPDSKDNAGSNTPIDAPVEDTEDEDMNISNDDERGEEMQNEILRKMSAGEALTDEENKFNENRVTGPNRKNGDMDTSPNPAPIEESEEKLPSAPLTPEQIQEKEEVIKKVAELAEKSHRGDDLTEEEKEFLDKNKPASEVTPSGKSPEEIEDEILAKIAAISPDLEAAMRAGDTTKAQDLIKQLPEEKQKEIWDEMAKLTKADLSQHDHEHKPKLSWGYRATILLLLYLSLELALFAKVSDSLKK